MAATPRENCWAAGAAMPVGVVATIGAVVRRQGEEVVAPVPSRPCGQTSRR